MVTFVNSIYFPQIIPLTANAFIQVQFLTKGIGLNVEIFDIKWRVEPEERNRWESPTNLQQRTQLKVCE